MQIDAQINDGGWHNFDTCCLEAEMVFKKNY
jgi:hypothetical protein